MGLRLCSLSSGSKGNCVIVASDSTAVLVDAGVGVSYIKKGIKALGLKNPKVLITHEHCDHIGQLAAITKEFNPEVYCHQDCLAAVKKSMKGGSLFAVCSDFFVGDITVSPFKVSHDVPCVGYSFYHAGRKLSVVTDLGYVGRQTVEAMKGSSLVFIEANHDEDLLLANSSYSIALKKRILSSRGHLSNVACGEALIEIVRSGAKQVVLGHLSQENNYPELAHTTVSRILNASGSVEGLDYSIEVVGAKKLSSVFELN